MARRFGIRMKLFVIGVVIALPLAAVTGFSYWQWYTSRIDQLVLERLFVARSLAASFTHMLDGMRSMSRVLGKDLLVRPNPSQEVRNDLDELVSNYPVEYVVLRDVRGRTMWTSDGGGRANTPPPPAVLRVLRGREWGIDPGRDESGVPGFHVAQSIRDEEGRLVAVIDVYVGIAQLHDALAVSFRGEAHIADSTGHLVYHSRFPRHALERRGWSDDPLLRDALDGREGHSVSRMLPVTGRAISAATPIRTVGWEADAAIDRDSVLAPVRRSLLAAIAMTLVVALLTSAVALNAGRTIVGSLRTLVVDAWHIGEGDFASPVRVSSRDEVGDVARSLDRTRIGLARYVSGLTGMSEAAALLGRSLGVSEVKDAIGRSARTLFDARAVWVLLQDEKSGATETFLWESDTVAGAPSVPPPAEEAAHATARVRTAEGPEAAEREVSWREAGGEELVRSMVWSPLTLGEKHLGVMGIASPLLALAPLDSRERSVLDIFAAQASTAIENARLFEAQQTIAETLQRSILAIPEHLPGLSVGHLYRSATVAAHVGGDFYDLFTLDDGSIGILLGDISGKGLEASTVTSVVKNTVHAYALDRNPPAEVVSKANLVLNRLPGFADFVTLFFGILDTSTGSLRYCSAGHPPAMVRRAAGGVAKLETGSPIVGPLHDAVYEDTEALLAPGDVLVLYTDGVTEARREGEFFGEERLADVIGKERVPAEEIPRLIYERVSDFTGGVLDDDIALLSLTRSDPGL